MAPKLDFQRHCRLFGFQCIKRGTLSLLALSDERLMSQKSRQHCRA